MPDSLLIAEQASRASAGLRLSLRRRRVILIAEERAVLVALKIAVLARSQGPEKRSEAQASEPERDWDERAENGHRSTLRRSAFNTTTIEEPDMAKAATNGVTNPITAMGIATRL